MKETRMKKSTRTNVSTVVPQHAPDQERTPAVQYGALALAGPVLPSIVEIDERGIARVLDVVEVIRLLNLGVSNRVRDGQPQTAAIPEVGTCNRPRM